MQIIPNLEAEALNQKIQGSHAQDRLLMKGRNPERNQDQGVCPQKVAVGLPEERDKVVKIVAKEVQTEGARVETVEEVEAEIGEVEVLREAVVGHIVAVHHEKDVETLPMIEEAQEDKVIIEGQGQHRQGNDLQDVQGQGHHREGIVIGQGHQPGEGIRIEAGQSQDLDVVDQGNDINVKVFNAQLGEALQLLFVLFKKISVVEIDFWLVQRLSFKYMAVMVILLKNIWGP